MGKKSRRQRQKQPKRNGSDDNNLTADEILSMDESTAESYQYNNLLNLPDFDEDEVASLPQTDAVWFADLSIKREYDENRGCEYTEVLYMVAMVEKEIGSNGLPFLFHVPRSEQECDGLSLCVAYCARKFDAIHHDRIELCNDLLKCIAKACLRPLNVVSTSNTPGRPRKILLSRIGFVRELKPKLRRIGLDEVDVADCNLIGSMKAGYEIPSNVRGLVFEMIRNSNRLFKRVSKEDYLKRHHKPHDDYLSEGREPLGTWQPQGPEWVPFIPHHWFARPPTSLELKKGFDWDDLMGWRTNLSRAVFRNDKKKVVEIASRYPNHLVKEYVEMRLLLTFAARDGKLSSCEALVEPHPKGCGACIDGVLSRNNKPEWRNYQRELSGDNGEDEGWTPLNYAAREGHCQIVAFLLEKGANPNLCNTCYGQGPLHYAIGQAHKDCIKLLLKGGPGGRSNVHLADNAGTTPLMVARYLAANRGLSRYKSIVTLLENADDGEICEAQVFGECCAGCGEAGAARECPCGVVSYCGVECQRRHWKEHKIEHRELMNSK